jgi:hypothetical protein
VPDRVVEQVPHHAAELSDVGKQISLLTNDRYSANQGSILKNAADHPAGEGVKRLYDEVTILSLRMMTRRDGEDRQEKFRKIQEKIAHAAGVSIPRTT